MKSESSCDCLSPFCVVVLVLCTYDERKDEFNFTINVLVKENAVVER